MKYSLMTISALAAVAVAEQPTLRNTNYNVVQGQDFTLKFSGCANSCTILLRNGPSSNLHTVPGGELTTKATGGTFTFTPPNNLPSDTYAFEIKDNVSGETNYSPQFSLQGTGVAISSAASSAASSAVSSQAVDSTAPATSSIVSSAAMTSMVTSAPAVSTKAPMTSAMAGNTTMLAVSSSTRSSGLTSGMSTSTASRPTGPATQVPSSDVGRLSAPLALAVGVVAAAALLG